ncbi:hypothetical protein [Mycobacterium sp. ACS4331]|uniref:hypothetical protein n=1 Tax=Mycobacterium sp. ACS4331 TaxID=1834121 RepID=UPI0012FAF194|nr:hypothetical protein [Mycobacterium sp. ACS4331]
MGRTSIGMEHEGSPPPHPKDATKATDEQREVQRQLEHQDEDPHGPGLQQSRRQVADEN